MHKRQRVRVSNRMYFEVATPRQLQTVNAASRNCSVSALEITQTASSLRSVFNLHLMDLSHWMRSKVYGQVKAHAAASCVNNIVGLYKLGCGHGQAVQCSTIAQTAARLPCLDADRLPCLPGQVTSSRAPNRHPVARPTMLVTHDAGCIRFDLTIVRIQ